MSLVSLQRVELGVGGPALLSQADFSLDPGERVCVVGRNGAGKSTLLRLIAGEVQPDDGRVVRADGLRIASLGQEVPAALSGTVFDVVASGLGELGADLARFHTLSAALDAPDSAQALAAVQTRIEAARGWDADRRVQEVLRRLDLPQEAAFVALSGGLKRRTLLGRALVAEPDVLLLDEPTNHLDLASIAWLEELLRGLRACVVFVTHDRRFLRALATRIVEIDRGKVSSWPGDYDDYLRRREERMHAEEREQALFDRRLANEEAWIRQGIKARRTRNEGRVRALEAMRRERSQRRERGGKVQLGLTTAQASGRRVIEVQDLDYAIGGQVLVKGASFSIQRGDRVGVLGPNGAGKTTLLRLLLGELAPTAGSVRLGTGLQIAYFDQHRAALREDWSALDNVAEGREFIELGERRVHALGYLQEFLFTPERARAPITALSGGERNRLLLARLFAQPSNLLVMDEPTNDLDVETLELLEETLAAYSGTLLLVSHDREFIDNVVTSTLVLEGEGREAEYVGGYGDWLRQRPGAAPTPAKDPVVPVRGATPLSATPAGRRKLGYNEQRELDALPARIEALEADIAARGDAMQSPEFYRQPPPAIAEAQRLLAERQAELEAAYTRWETLEGAR